jgi:flagellar biosynthesis/type III secretory pathway chaperone
MTASAAATWFPEDRKFVSPETYDAFVAVVERLEAVIDTETRMLASGRTIEIAEATRQKRQGFLELSRLMRTMERTIPSQDILSRLAAFRGKLEANDEKLRVHLQAVRAVNALIVDVMREAESDGTYSRGYGRYADADA